MSIVHFSKETPLQTSARLLGVLRRSTMQMHGAYRLVSVSYLDAAVVLNDALAVVRDGDTFSALVPALEPSAQDFGVLSFHFASDDDNSGFVGWLASLFKQRVGTGVIVVCGLSASGVVFDYWGVPHEHVKRIIRLINELCAHS